MNGMLCGLFRESMQGECSCCGRRCIMCSIYMCVVACSSLSLMRVPFRVCGFHLSTTVHILSMRGAYLHCLTKKKYNMPTREAVYQIIPFFFFPDVSGKNPDASP